MKRANPKAVGGFVIVAVALALAAIVVFGGGRFLETKQTFVAYFPGSLMGLRKGAPVEMRGIQIGTVSDGWVEAEEDGLEFSLPVLMEIELSRIRGIEPAEAGKSRLDELIDRGLRAQLVAQSFVTGQQSIQLDFHPDTPVNLVETDLPYPQVPTIPSLVEEVTESLGDVAKQAGVVLAKVSDLLSDENRASFGRTLKNVDHLTSGLADQVGRLDAIVTDVGDIVHSLKADTPKLSQAVETADETLLSYKKLAEDADDILVENREGIAKAIAGLRQVESKTGALVDSANKLIEDNDSGIKDFTNEGLYEITNLAVDAQAAVEQFRRVLEEMERDPARFFLGKPGQVEVQ